MIRISGFRPRIWGLETFVTSVWGHADARSALHLAGRAGFQEARGSRQRGVLSRIVEGHRCVARHHLSTKPGDGCRAEGPTVDRRHPNLHCAINVRLVQLW